MISKPGEISCPQEFKGYKYIEFLGNGSYGTVCSYEKNGYKYAVKFEE